jgi:hypothetical protein
MNCKCMTNQREAINNSFLEKGKKVQSVEFPSGLGIVEKGGKSNLIIVSYSEVSVRVEGKKKVEKLKFTHSFCPFCGLKITSEE